MRQNQTKEVIMDSRVGIWCDNGSTVKTLAQETATDWLLCPPKLICWGLILSVMILGGGGFGRWLGHEGGAPANGICALIRDTTELPCPFCEVQLQQDDSPWTRKGALIGHDIRLHLDPGPSAPRTGGNKCRLFINPAVYGIFVVEVPTDWYKNHLECIRNRRTFRRPLK